jgi:uncharacterized protein YidB (DUF937 family)
MGLLDGLVGQAVGQMLGGQQGSPQGGALLSIVTALIQENGGLGGLLQKFEQSGLGAHAASWVGTGSNMPINADQITAALGGGTLGNLAAKFGISPEQVSGALANALPQAVDHLTPNGQVAQSDSLDSLASTLGGLFKS